MPSWKRSQSQTIAPLPDIGELEGVRLSGTFI
jgi:hypothetical protein